MRVFLLTGEPSGDLHGARLADALRALEPEITITGAGGARMRRAGVHLVAESEHWGAIGIPDALRKAPYLYLQAFRLIAKLWADPPDVLVPIDFGAFNLFILRRLRRRGIRTVYYIPPGCWSRHRTPGELPFLVDAVATPFPWSAENLRSAGVPARIEWVGHPILDYIAGIGSRAEAQARLNLDPARPTIAVVPGSRRSELHFLLPGFLGALRHLPAPQVLLAVAPSLGEAAIRRAIRRCGADDLDLHLLDGLDDPGIMAADAALAASGTATLELACRGIPMVASYRGSFASWLQYRLFLYGKLRHISLPNILADADVVPELLQDAASPEGLAAALAPLLADTPARRAQLDAFTSICANLGDGHACERTARLVLDVARG